MNPQEGTGPSKGVLAGVSILDLSRLVAGNILSHVLADFGADVVKVEPIGGDALRDWRMMNESTFWSIYSRNKRSLGLDFRANGSTEVILRLVAQNNIFIENFRPGTLEKMGLSPEILHAANPKLVIVRISGFGQEGPYSSRPGFGTLIEAMSGYADINGFPDKEPALPPIPLADNFAGLYGAVAAMIALRHVENGGAGQVIDVPLFEPLFAMMGPLAADYELTGKVKQRAGNRALDVGAPRNTYKTKDGKWIAISAAMQGTAERLFRAIGRPDMITDPRFATNSDRSRNVTVLDEIIAQHFNAIDAEEAMRGMTEADVTAAPIMNIAQILTDPHVIARDVVVRMPCGTLAHNVVPRMLGTPGAINSAAPDIGEHSRQILLEAGYTTDDVALLLQGNVVVQSRRAADE